MQQYTLLSYQSPSEHLGEQQGPMDQERKKHCIVTQRQTIGAEELFGIILGLDYAFVYFHDNNKGLQII